MERTELSDGLCASDRREYAAVFIGKRRALFRNQVLIEKMGHVPPLLYGHGRDTGQWFPTLLV